MHWRPRKCCIFEDMMEHNLQDTISLLTRTPATLNALLRDLPETWTSRNEGDRKSTRLNSSHGYISYAVFCLKKKKSLLCIRLTCRDNRVVSATRLALPAR